MKIPNLVNLLQTKLGIAICFTSPVKQTVASLPSHLLHVMQMGFPIKVIAVIVGSIVVAMATLHAWCWKASKCQQNKSMNVPVDFTISVVQGNKQIAVVLFASLQSLPLCSRSTVSMPAAPHGTIIANAVIWKTEKIERLVNDRHVPDSFTVGNLLGKESLSLSLPAILPLFK